VEKVLPSDAYAVLFEERTERACSSALDKQKRPGTFVCAACCLPLVTSETKFDSGTGWPSFYKPIEGSVETKRDYWRAPPAGRSSRADFTARAGAARGR
jgi:peptide-methionine (R)-S-oxide reductase